MTTYVPARAYWDHQFHPGLLLLIGVGHAALIGALMMMKMDVSTRLSPPKTTIDFIPAPSPPPPHPTPPQPRAQNQEIRPTLDHPQELVAAHLQDRQQIDTSANIPSFTPTNVQPILPERPSEPVRTGPRFATPQSELKPPYPPAKELAGEEATLRLRLSIDAQGRVTAVEPVSSADPEFLAAARKHILAHWRYEPASEGGRAVPSSTVVTLQFKLDG